MDYFNAKDILPPDLLREIQKYINGAAIYIPLVNEVKKSWGIKNGARRKYDERNEEIKYLHKNGMTVGQLAGKFFLSADSIRKIVR